MLKASTLAATLLLTVSALAQDSIAEKTKSLEKLPGLIETHLDAKQAKAFLKLPAPQAGSDVVGEYLYTESLATGLGANDIGLDRGQVGNTWVLRVRRIGNKVLFEVPNSNFRATQGGMEEQRATTEAFATSIVWATPVVATDPDGASLVDITDFLVRDAHGSADSLREHGGYSLDKERSTLNPAMCKAFPDNLEFEALLTFRSGRPGRAIGDHAPAPEFVTLAQRHSFVRLPDAGYQPRAFDPRAGSFSISYLDFSARLGEPLVKRYIVRHRPGKPLVYYVDRGVPEPIRTALIEGGNYWQQAFERAGLKGMFRVELMPEGMDPMDVRNNVILWTNRSTRGWAYGLSVVDPRTGEIVRGVVNLDSQRARHDLTLFEALVGVAQSGKGAPNDPIDTVLARIRQLSAHEIGHTLGFQHNFAASVNRRASVMDYPYPEIKLTSAGKIFFSNAYAEGTGDWDARLVRYAYGQPPNGGDEATWLKSVIDEGLRQGLLFLSDADASESTGSNPLASRWDYGRGPVLQLRHAMRVREIAMAQFGERNIRPGEPIGNLELVFGPLYYFHRYSVDTVAKMVGGTVYAHTVRGDGAPAAQPVPAAEQREALAALLDCLRPEFLNVPPSISRLMGTRPNGYGASREEFPTRTAFVFDTTTAASSAADLVLARLLDPVRAARVVELSARDSSLPTLDEVLTTLVDRVCSPVGTNDRMRSEISWTVQHALAARLMGLAESESPGVRSRGYEALRRMRGIELEKVSADTTGHAAEIARAIERYLARPAQAPTLSPPPPALPGAPIGMADCGM